MSRQDEVQTSGALAHAIAEHAKQAIGPNGTVLKVPEDDAQLIRATFIAKLAEAATKLANGEPLR
ncbi:hypothetical protein MYP14_06130 [Rhodococcus pyridinivorans]|uniref:hypothetical protein n=1 Tax=Rhodococcus pyridinivorans TaxID=103816 RepID=UPI001FFF0B75|nr:hypothetical protein [Rhodococcus pyridinivorans]UPK64927.1 hypothetical protein MYP14_06130 [Rhodococcus pyridinivorans]